MRVYGDKFGQGISVDNTMYVTFNVYDGWVKYSSRGDANGTSRASRMTIPSVLKLASTEPNVLKFVCDTCEAWIMWRESEGDDSGARRIRKSLDASIENLYKEKV